MKATFTAIVLLVFALALASEVVQVHEGGLSFSVEAVKKLQELTESSDAVQAQSPRLLVSNIAVCDDPDLPQELLPLCKQKGASASFARLAMVPMDVCEICAFAACTGC
ncbi:guanylin-like [Thalassophryne amazonica]|uniref:guanylin-like n=1 Tax=Thalassophryne amazonica TaxID=390379 RepID=UPI0014716A02|nr:guanylin-like [Thalassophryne amazonica]